MNDYGAISEEKPFGPSGTFNGFKHNEPVILIKHRTFSKMRWWF
jgi:hypothetical protein